ncbi:MAG: hypothetical protein PHV68_07415 [Candidatus Gastranaerophilales bacterium]|nr:hypothetical protein [Candidatus Gastranaerophilales bacterium]
MSNENQKELFEKTGQSIGKDLTGEAFETGGKKVLENTGKNLADFCRHKFKILWK